MDYSNFNNDNYIINSIKTNIKNNGGYLSLIDKIDFKRVSDKYDNYAHICVKNGFGMGTKEYYVTPSIKTIITNSSDMNLKPQYLNWLKELDNEVNIHSYKNVLDKIEENPFYALICPIQTFAKNYSTVSSFLVDIKRRVDKVCKEDYGSSQWLKNLVDNRLKNYLANYNKMNKRNGKGSR